MATTNTRVLRDSQPEGQEGVTDLPDNATAQDMALLQAVRNGKQIIRKSTGKPVTVEELEAELEAASSNKSAKPTKKKPKQTADPNDKYANMSREDVIKMHQQAQTKIGEQGQEVGQLRNLTDKLLDLKRTDDLTAHGGSPEDSPISGDTLLTNPRDTIKAVVEETLAPLTEKINDLGQSTIEQKFEKQFPSYQADMGTTVFQQWVQASPYRLGLAQKAYQQDWDAATELFSAYEEVRETVGDTDDAAGGDEGQGNNVASADSRADALAAASMVSGAGGAGDVSAKPIYSRQALINKRIQDPSGYYDPAFQAIITEAYTEGRVK